MEVCLLGGEDCLEEGMTTHSSNFAWRTPWTGEPGGLQFRVAKSGTRLKQLSIHAHSALTVWVLSAFFFYK